MGSPVTANLAYGYDIGNVGEPAFEDAAWFDDESDTEPVVQLFDALYAAIPDAPAEGNADRRQSVTIRHFGVEVAFCGTDDFTGWVLIASGSEQEACNADTLALDVGMFTGLWSWDEKLAAVLQVLGFTPIQDGPRWLVFPSCG